DLAVISGAFFLVAIHHDVALIHIAQWIAPVYLALLLSKSYQTFWNHPDQGDYFRLFRTIFLGFLASWILNSFSPTINLGTTEFFLAFCVTFTGMVTERLALYFVRMELIKQHTCSPLRGTPPQNVLLYGVGLGSATYLNYLLDHVKKATNEKILGLIDRDLTFRYGYCYGYRVLGNLDNLQEIFRKTPFQKIVLCKDDLTDNERNFLKNFCRAQNITITRFACNENTEHE
ncbi:MAG: hypothetical protein GX927_04355, partial [Lentisphaerae bacterium]|nr:hypothetical protein [Lentisphaerota bacterium]